VKTLPRAHDRAPHAVLAARRVRPALVVSGRQLEREEVLDGVHDHLAVVVGQDAMTFGGEPDLQLVAVGDVAVVSAVDRRLAGDEVGLGVAVVDGAEGGPADLAAEDASWQVDDAELVDHEGGGADAFDECDVVGAVTLDRGACRIVAAVFEGFEELRGDDPEVLARVFEDQSDDSAHGGKLIPVARGEYRDRTPENHRGRRRHRRGGRPVRR
jgi:hypothetical protein